MRMVDLVQRAGATVLLSAEQSHDEIRRAMLHSFSQAAGTKVLLVDDTVTIPDINRLVNAEVLQRLEREEQGGSAYEFTNLPQCDNTMRTSPEPAKVRNGFRLPKTSKHKHQKHGTKSKT